jgi:hypothetical protein
MKASDPVGIYCIVTNVVMAPDDKAPATAQIWGACAPANGSYQENGTWVPGWYDAPRKGYMYYAAPKGKEDIVLREWSDLKKVAGTGEVVGFGSRGQNVGRVRLATEQPRDPDVYPIHNGVTKLNAQYAGLDSYQGLVLALKKAIGTK